MDFEPTENVDRSRPIQFEVTDKGIVIRPGEITYTEFARLIRSGELFAGHLDEESIREFAEENRELNDRELVEKILPLIQEI